MAAKSSALLLADADAAGAATVARRSLALIASEPIAGINVTASAGVAHWATVLRYPFALLTAADEALYEAKGAGRAQAKSWVEPFETADGEQITA